MLLFFQQVLNGLTLGGIYSLVALGLILVALAALSERLIFRLLQGTSGLHSIIAIVGLLTFALSRGLTAVAIRENYAAALKQFDPVVNVCDIVEFEP